MLGELWQGEGSVTRQRATRGGISSAGGALGFAGAQEGDGGEARPLPGVSGRHPPGRGRLLVVSSASARSQLGGGGVGVHSQPPSVPVGLAQGDFEPPMFLL